MLLSVVGGVRIVGVVIVKRGLLLLLLLTWIRLWLLLLEEEHTSQLKMYREGMQFEWQRSVEECDLQLSIVGSDTSFDSVIQHWVILDY